MTSWYQIKISFTREENDKVKTINEVYLFDAVSYTDAEARGYDYCASNVPGFQLNQIQKMKLNEVFFNDNPAAEHWFKCRIQYIVFDEKTKSEKKTAVMMLVCAENLKQAYEILVDRLGSVDDYIISDINVTKIVEVIPYEEDVEMKIKNGTLKPLAAIEAAIENTEPEAQAGQ